ncbi:hypothetical protein GGX14DRAFT_566752 [Mycena pura]|uniref:Uncharacterized protein n=1 Tax=Mycena pura TaxID=153505 RepID=A0AAD6VBU3_9AGAR|nr:hypothetical protein GGX14DRAFT_566752 [Mycena pura]
MYKMHTISRSRDLRLSIVGMCRMYEYGRGGSRSLSGHANTFDDVNSPPPPAVASEACDGGHESRAEMGDTKNDYEE